MKKFLLIIAALAALTVGAVSYSASKSVHSLKANDDGSISVNVFGGNSTTIPILKTAFLAESATEDCQENCTTPATDCEITDIKMLRVGPLVTIGFHVNIDPTTASTDTSCRFDPTEGVLGEVTGVLAWSTANHANGSCGLQHNNASGAPHSHAGIGSLTNELLQIRWADPSASARDYQCFLIMELQ